jgi:phosphopentomutase
MTGHWELAGAVIPEPFAVYPQFPQELVEKLSRATRASFLGNCARNGVLILQELGEEHLRTGQPILYTSADSVMQIAAHERVMPPARLYEICRHARRLADAWHIGRVIARPFGGELGQFERTAGRHDYPMVPPRTVLNAIAETGLAVTGVGRVGSIFAGSGITRSIRADSNPEAMAAIDRLWEADEDGLIFANIGDFDTLHGHPRDLPGFARALAEFDDWLHDFLPAVEEEDLLIITADHGNDPSFRGNDHTREEVPLLVRHAGKHGPLGTRKSFADVAATLAQYFRVRGGWPSARSFL